MTSLADQIIEHGPWQPGEVQRGFRHLPLTDETQLNALRDELIEGRRLRKAAVEALDRVVRDLRANYRTGDKSIEYINGFEDAAETLAELVRRADEHTEECA
jgi:hypothetical protein